MKQLERHTLNGTLLIGTALALAGCMTESEQFASSSAELVSVEGDNCATLYAGQNTDAGAVCTSIDGDYLVVSYDTVDGWEITYAHLWVGRYLADMPQARNGNPKIGNFPHHSGDIAATSYEFRLPLSEWGLTGSDTECDPLTLLVAAHADLRKADGSGGYQTETGWAEGDTLGRSWAMYTSIVLTCDDGPGTGDGSCTTAYGYAPDEQAGTCFIGADFDGDGEDDGFGNGNKWGWSIGPLAPAPSTYSYAIYAGAGQCDTSKGTRVGTLTVAYDGSEADVTYTADTGFGFTQLHSYVGNDPLPRVKNGPDAGLKYCTANGASCMDLVEEFDTEQTSFTWSAAGLSGDIYVVAHSVACGPGLD